MTRQDIEKLFNLMDVLYPNVKKRRRDAATLEAWALVLGPWTYEEGKQALIVWAREKRFPPDTFELTPLLPTRPEGEGNQKTPKEAALPTAPWLDRFAARSAALRERCRRAGIPTPAEGHLQGLTYAAWNALAARAGV